MPLKALKAKAKKDKIPGYSKMTHAQLLSAMTGIPRSEPSDDDRRKQLQAVVRAMIEEAKWEEKLSDVRRDWNKQVKDANKDVKDIIENGASETLAGGESRNVEPMVQLNRIKSAWGDLEDAKAGRTEAVKEIRDKYVAARKKRKHLVDNIDQLSLKF